MPPFHQAVAHPTDLDGGSLRDVIGQKYTPQTFMGITESPIDWEAALALANSDTLSSSEAAYVRVMAALAQDFDRLDARQMVPIVASLGNVMIETQEDEDEAQELLAKARQMQKESEDPDKE